MPWVWPEKIVRMSDEARTAGEDTAGSDGHGPRDRSPREANRAQPAQRAEVSNFEIVDHWFTLAADRLEIPEDVRGSPELLLPGGPGPDPGLADRRQDPRLLRLPRPAQRRARPVQGRDPLPPRGRPRRGARARVADDLEDRDREHPLRRGKGGVNCDPSELERGEVEKIARSFMDKIEKVLGPTRDIPAPDVGTNAQTMAWIMDEYGKLHGHTPAIVTGKPIALEGSYGREAATGRGVVYMLEEAAKNVGLKLEGARVVVQGYGNVGSWAARTCGRARVQARRRRRRRRRDPQRRGDRPRPRSTSRCRRDARCPSTRTPRASRRTTCSPPNATC